MDLSSCICLRSQKIFFLAFDKSINGANKVQRNSERQYFFPSVNITKYNVLIDGRSFYDQPITDQIKNMMKLQEDKEMITQQDVCWIINTSNITINELQVILANKKN